MRQVITDGYLYIAQPPLYRVQYGKEIYYAFTESERDAAMGEIKEKHKNARDPEVTRYKGLGEMNPDQLWDTTMNPATRTLLRAPPRRRSVRYAHGDQVPPRKKFIQTHAKYVRNLTCQHQRRPWVRWSARETRAQAARATSVCQRPRRRRRDQQSTRGARGGQANGVALVQGPR
jgi:hypothetical protein